ncbi:MAG: class I SAM-dependent methyltransferase [Verrucomicrobiota bacterium]
MNAPANSLNCLLCSGKLLKNSAQLNGLEIRALWRGCNKEFPPEALVGISENSNIILWQCAGCGFEFFDPSLAGNSLFYQCLESSEYYSSNRPEFQRTTQLAVKKRLTNVLDVGCGAGDFLDLARSAGLRTFGLELNPTAAEKARAKGHEVFDRLLDKVPADACPGGFDLITLFQVLEHVPDPVGVIKQAAEHLKVGGYIAIAVPSKSGIYRFLPWDPAQWPPHHISRWRLKDFKTLAETTKLRLTRSGGDMLLGSAIEQTINFRRQQAAAYGRYTHIVNGSWPAWVSWIYRKAGLKFIAPRWGSSIFAYFQKV